MIPRRAVLFCLVLVLGLFAGSAAAQECTGSSDCPDRSDYCRKNAGACDGEGECEQRPEACTDVLDPVCGCDGETYGNSCAAAAVGVNVARKGECDDRSCSSARECGDDELCQKPIGDCAGAGRCQPRPEICTALFDPVCGCDGKTFSNGCNAARSGVNVAHGGEC